MTSPTPGRLVLVVGPSGAGKDTLMAATAALAAEEPRLRLVQRHVTRPRDAGGEAHRPVSVADYEAARAAGRYCLAWSAHGLHYGIPAEVVGAVRDGAIAVVNGSRKVLPEALALGVPVAVIQITAPPDVLAARLSQRGRESADDIRARLAREAALPALDCPVVTVMNDGTVAEGEARFLAALRTLSVGDPG